MTNNHQISIKNMLADFFYKKKLSNLQIKYEKFGSKF